MGFPFDPKGHDWVVASSRSHRSGDRLDQYPLEWQGWGKETACQ